MKGHRCIMLILWHFIKYDDCNTTNTWRDPPLPSSSNRLLISQCGSLLSGFKWLLPVWLNYFELYGNATVRCSPCRSSYLEILLHFCSTDLDKKRNIWKNQVFYFFSNQESWQARQFWVCEMCSSLYSEVAWFNARHLGRGKELQQRRLHRTEFFFFSFA